MIGIIITGHGHFASGIKSSVHLISGEPEFFEAVDFTIEDTNVSLENNLLKAIDHLSDCSSIIIFTDLVGGSPFKISAELSVRLKGERNIQVVSGTNLGGVIETVLSRNFVDDVIILADSSLETAHDQLIRFDLGAVSKHEEVDTGDGI